MIIIERVEQQQTNDDEVSSRRFSASMLTLGLASLLALAIRCYGLYDQSFSNDEVIDLEIARLPWSEIVFQADGFPPLHHLILKVMLMLTGSDLAGRWLAVTYGVLAVPVVGLLAQRILGLRGGIVASVLLAILPMHVYFSQEGRSYALFFLLVALATWLFWRALETNSSRAWTLFALSASLGGYAHYYFCFLLLALALIWIRHAIADGAWRYGLTAWVGLAVLQLPLLMLLGYDVGCQQSMQQTHFSWEALGFTGWALLTGFCLGPSLRELHDATAATAIQQILPWLVPTGIVSLYWLASLVRQTSRYRLELLVLLLMPLGGASIAAGWLEISYNVRYVVPCLLPSVLLLAAALTTDSRKWLVLVVSVLLVTTSVVSLVNRHSQDRYRNEDARAAFEFLAAHTAGPRRVFTISHYLEISARYYLPLDYEVLELTDVEPDGEGLAEVVGLINQYDGPYWVYYSREFHGDPARIFKRTLQNSPSVEHMGSWTGIELFRGTTPLNVPAKNSLP